MNVCGCGCGQIIALNRRFVIGHSRRLSTKPMADRFWPKVDKSGDCWLWTGYVNPNGYGEVRGPDGRSWKAHRAAYVLTHGDIPAGLQLDHLCRNRACVNPSHLEAVTQRVNILRGKSPSARNAFAKECSRGHPFDSVNTRWKANGKGRECRQCAREQQPARYARWLERHK